MGYLFTQQHFLTAPEPEDIVTLILFSTPQLHSVLISPALDLARTADHFNVRRFSSSIFRKTIFWKLYCERKQCVAYRPLHAKTTSVQLRHERPHHAGPRDTSLTFSSSASDLLQAGGAGMEVSARRSATLPGRPLCADGVYGRSSPVSLCSLLLVPWTRTSTGQRSSASYGTRTARLFDYQNLSRLVQCFSFIQSNVDAHGIKS